MVDLVEGNTYASDSTSYSTNFLQGNTMVVAKELLKSRNDLDIE